MPASNTIQLATTIAWAQYFIGNRSLTLYGGSDPAMTIANWVLEVIYAPPFKWRWNRNTFRFLTIDPKGWIANNPVTAGYRIIDSNGNMQTVTTPGTTGATVPAWTTTIPGTTTDNTVIWTGSRVSDYVNAISNFGYIEKASLTTTAAPITVTVIPNVGEAKATSDVGTGRWQYIYAFSDDNAGNITFRPFPGIPDALYYCDLVFQGAPPLFTSIGTNVWPVPDRYASLYQTGFLAFTYLFVDDARAAFMLQRFAAGLLAASDGLDDTQKNAFLEQWDVFVTSKRAAAKGQQGIGARAAS